MSPDADDLRVFRRSDPDFPTTRAVQQRLVDASRVEGEGPLAQAASAVARTPAAPPGARLAAPHGPCVPPIIRLLGLTLAVPDHTTLSCRAETLEVPRPRPRRSGEPLHLLVDSTGLKFCGSGEWLVEKHGTKTRRSWRKLHIALDADTGQIVVAALTAKEVDDGAEVGPLLDQVTATVASFTGDGAYDQEGVSAAVAERFPDATIIVPPRSTAVPSETAETAPTQRDRHLQSIAEHGRAAWQKASGYTKRARAEAAIGRFKQVIGDGLRGRGRGTSSVSARRLRVV